MRISFVDTSETHARVGCGGAKVNVVGGMTTSGLIMEQAAVRHDYYGRGFIEGNQHAGS